MTERENLEALRAVLATAKAGWESRESNMSFPPQFGVVQRMIDDQEQYVEDPVRLAVHCMGLFAEFPFDMLAVLVLSDKHLSEDTIVTLETDLEEADGREFEALRFFKLGKGNAGFLIEVPGDDEDWDELPPGDLFDLLKYADDRSCTWVLVGPEHRMNEDLETFPAGGSPSHSE
jgi:hypothetical protein